jgi:glycosyltransferase involved in cell wall biosynthesis
MRILFISTLFPRESQKNVSGGFLRMGMMIDALKEIGQLDMFFYVPSDVDVSPSALSRMEDSLGRHWNADIRLFLCPRFVPGETLTGWQRYGASSLSFMKHPDYMATSMTVQVRALEACLAQQKPDVVFAYKLPSICPLLGFGKNHPPVFLDLDDVEHLVLFRSILNTQGFRKKMIRFMRFPALFWGERKALRFACRTFVCSERDRQYLAKRLRLQGIATVPNAVNKFELLPIPSSPTLLFLGTYGYEPNTAAAEFLIRQIWPKIFEAMPEARLIIAGPEPERIPSYSKNIPGVEYSGFVEDLEALYRRSRVVCCPILWGGGTRIKIIEAAAYGRPIVSTTIGAEGLDLSDGSDILLRDDPKSFAEACLHLLKDPESCRQLGSYAYFKAYQLYDLNKVIRSIQQHVLHARPCA